VKKNYAIILSAGKGQRMGGPLPKQYLPLGDRLVLAHSIHTFDLVSSVDELVFVISGDDQWLSGILKDYPPQKPYQVAEGGAVRQESVYNALSLVSSDAGIVTLHDGARPLVTTGVIEACISAAEEYGAAAAGMPVKDTIKQVDDRGFAVHTPERSTLWLVQTPQTFKFELIMKAHKAALRDGFVGTDDSSLIERLGHKVKMIPGGYENIKITTPDDIIAAEQLLKARRGFK
jgi:2-C-methyl-D-erythritol 4-phosphate cytidylyltransferase